MSVNPEALPGWFNRRNSGKPRHNDAASTDDPAAPAAQTSTGARTGGGKDDQTPVVVWEAANRMEAEIVAGRLHSEGIPAIIRGESLGTIYGLTTGSLAAANVLVPGLLAEKAIAILANTVEWDDTDDPPLDASSVDEATDTDAA